MPPYLHLTPMLGPVIRPMVGNRIGEANKTAEELRKKFHDRIIAIRPHLRSKCMS
jgi:hypothetical protein